MIRANELDRFGGFISVLIQCKIEWTRPLPLGLSLLFPRTHLDTYARTDSKSQLPWSNNNRVSFMNIVLFVWYTKVVVAFLLCATVADVDYVETQSLSVGLVHCVAPLQPLLPFGVRVIEYIVALPTSSNKSWRGKLISCRLVYSPCLPSGLERGWYDRGSTAYPPRQIQCVEVGYCSKQKDRCLILYSIARIARELNRSLSFLRSQAHPSLAFSFSAVTSDWLYHTNVIICGRGPSKED